MEGEGKPEASGLNRVRQIDVRGYELATLNRHTSFQTTPQNESRHVELAIRA